MKKSLKFSVLYDKKQPVEIKIYDFNTKRFKDNHKVVNMIWMLIEKYNLVTDKTFINRKYHVS